MSKLLLMVGAGYRVMTGAAGTAGAACCPILMLTAKDATTDHFWAGEVGADAFLTKPADIPLLLQTVADLTDRA